MEYNAAREHLVMREYGRHIQKMVNHVLTIEDKNIRQKQAEGIVELMAFLNPQLRTIEDYKHKLWDHLFVISSFKLDVETPYGKPEKATYKTKPGPLRYPKRKPKYNHLGKNLELVINKAMEEENPEKKSGFAHVIAHYMKLAYSNWHKELVHDDGIRQELNSITNGELEFSNTPFVRHRMPNFREDEGYGYAKRANSRNFRNNNRNNSNRNENRGGSGSNGGQFRDNRGGNGGGQQASSRGNNSNNKFNNKKRFK